MEHIWVNTNSCTSNNELIDVKKKTVDTHIMSKQQPHLLRSNRNVFEATHALRRFFKIFGINCFTISFTQGVLTHVTVVDSLLFLLNVTFTITLIIVPHNTTWLDERDKLISDGIVLLFRYSLLVAMYAITSGFIWQRHRIVALLVAIHKIDEQLLVCAVYVPHRHHRRVMIGFVIAMCVNNICMSIFNSGSIYFASNIDVWPILVNVIQQSYLCMCNTNVFAVYIFSLLALQERIRLLNIAIGTIAAQTQTLQIVTLNSGFGCIPHPLGRCDALGQLRKMHSELTEMVGQCNYYFAAPVMGLCVTIFGYLLFYLFTLNKGVLSRYTSSSFGLLTSYFWWTAFYTGMLLMLVHVSSRLSQTTSRTGRCVHAALNNLGWPMDRVIIGKLMLFSRELMHRKPVAGCGLFSFDWPLVHSVDTIIILSLRTNKVLCYIVDYRCQRNVSHDHHTI